MGGKAGSIGGGSEALWHEFHEAVLAFFRRRVDSDALAEDLLMECFLRIHKGIDTVSESSSIRAWVYRIARNLVIDHYRSRKPSDELGEHAASPADEPNAEALAFGSCLLSMIDRLPERYREPMRLVEIEGLSQRELASRLGLSSSGAKSRVQRGRARLKDLVSGCCRVEMDKRGNVLEHDCQGACC